MGGSISQEPNAPTQMVQVSLPPPETVTIFVPIVAHFVVKLSPEPTEGLAPDADHEYGDVPPEALNVALVFNATFAGPLQAIPVGGGSSSSPVD